MVSNSSCPELVGSLTGRANFRDLLSDYFFCQGRDVHDGGCTDIVGPTKAMATPCCRLSTNILFAAEAQVIEEGRNFRPPENWLLGNLHPRVAIISTPPTTSIDRCHLKLRICSAQVFTHHCHLVSQHLPIMAPSSTRPTKTAQPTPAKLDPKAKAAKAKAHMQQRMKSNALRRKKHDDELGKLQARVDAFVSVFQGSRDELLLTLVV
jgi:hypothetical protein